MATRRRQVEPKTFFLNERHELSPVEREGGGRLPQYADISWGAKSKRLHRSLTHVAQSISASHDPLRDHRYFVLARPVAQVEKKSKNKKKAPKGTFKEPTNFGGAHGRVFERLGLDLLHVTDDGRAVVHAEKDKFEQLAGRASALAKLGQREQARWVTIDEFDLLPPQLRVDADWVGSLTPNLPLDVIIELQPVLSRVEVETVLRAVSDLLMQRNGERLTGTGSDFSGRQWFRGKASSRSVRDIAKDFFSIQSLHPPLYSVAAAKKVRKRTAASAVRPTMEPVDVESLPCVAVVDLGVASEHKQLAQFRRGAFVPQDAARAAVGDHGAFVASRVVFGHRDSHDAFLAAQPKCSFFDAMVGDYPTSPDDNRVHDKVVMDALRGVKGAAPDVRVFNLSFGDSRPLASLSDVERREKRLMLQDLDNFVFAHDVLIVVAAGNSKPGLIPASPYPDHQDDPNWALGPWASGFNTLVCGSVVNALSSQGVAKAIGWPSPFTRVGPGLCDAPIPSFCAQGGNCNDQYSGGSGLGVLGYSGTGLIEDRLGTSQAAPILAREAAFALQRLQAYCATGGYPFAVTAKAFLRLTAVPTTDDRRVKHLVDRTLGCGQASSDRVSAARAGSAVILWQGYINSSDEKVRVQLPVPREWLAASQHPVLRLVVCWDTPVSEAATATWACRKVMPVIHLGPDEPYVRAPGGDHHSFPVIDRRYNLSRFAGKNVQRAPDDLWLIELAYSEIAPYAPALEFDARQRVAIAAELVDIGDGRIDPQPALQALPVTSTMTHLSSHPVPVKAPVLIKARP